MKRSDVQQLVNAHKWFHRIDIVCEDGIVTTPGTVDHCGPRIATERFGIPENLTGKMVLDVGAYDGYFSFLAEKRGAEVTAIDNHQDCSNVKHTDEAFKTARNLLQSNVKYHPVDLKTWADDYAYDITFYFGVLYHVDDPITNLLALRKLTREYALIETAVYRPGLMDLWQLDLWKFRPGYHGDPTNKWYGTPAAVVSALKHVGFKDINLIHTTPDKERVTFKAYV